MHEAAAQNASKQNVCAAVTTNVPHPTLQLQMASRNVNRGRATSLQLHTAGSLAQQGARTSMSSCSAWRRPAVPCTAHLCGVLWPHRLQSAAGECEAGRFCAVSDLQLLDLVAHKVHELLALSGNTWAAGDGGKGKERRVYRSHRETVTTFLQSSMLLPQPGQQLKLKTEATSLTHASWKAAITALSCQVCAQQGWSKAAASLPCFPPATHTDTHTHLSCWPAQ